MVEYSSPICLELKQVVESNEEGRFSGYAARFGNVDLNGDRIEPGAFGASIAASKGRVPVFNEHVPTNKVGVATSLSEDHKGLLADVKLSLDTIAGRDAFNWLKFCKSTDFNQGLSIGFLSKDWELDRDVRVLKSIDLHEISLVAFPANPRARVAEIKQDKTRLLEQILRDAGFTGDEAKEIVVATKKTSSEALREVSGLKQSRVRQLGMLLLSEAYNAKRYR